MSKQKMQRAQALIKAKRYSEARYILETVDHPTAEKWLSKLERLDPSWVDELPEIDWQAHTPRRSSNRLVLILGLVLVVLAAVVIVAIAVLTQPSAEDQALATVAAAVTVIAEVDAEMQSILSAPYSVYCESLDERSKGGCQRWTDAVLSERLPEALACYEEYDSIFDKANFSSCLLFFGIAPVGDTLFVDRMDLADMQSDIAIQGVVRLKIYCTDYSSRNEAFCDVWSQLTYMLQRTTIQQCVNAGPLDESIQCFRSQDIRP